MTSQPVDKIQGDLSLLADGLGTALDELREISHGIHPAILSEAGLGPALEALARRSPVPVELDLNLGPRLGEHVEAAGYYIASEAITNVAKHAQASVIDMRVDGCDGALTLSISDDGIGGADPSRGSGIIGLKDRVEALGGTIAVVSPPGHGTALHVQLPADPMAPPTARALRMAAHLGGTAASLSARGAGRASPAAVTIRRIACADSSRFGKNPAAGLSAIGPAKSASERVEIRITAGPPSRWCPARRRASSNPLSSPSMMSTRTTSGWSSCACRSASTEVAATPTTRRPSCSRRPRAASRNNRLSSTMRTPNAM